MRTSKDAKFSTVLEQRETTEAFVEGYHRRLVNGSMHPKVEILNGRDYVHRAKAKNLWAKAVAEFDTNLNYGAPLF